jgi:hypothetical protein
MENQIEFFPTVIEDTEDGKGRETKRKGRFTAQQIDPISFKRALEILGLDGEDLLPLLETDKIHSFRRITYGPGEAPLHYEDTPPDEANYEPLWPWEHRSPVEVIYEPLYPWEYRSPGEIIYEPLWPWEYRSLDTEDLKKLYFCLVEVEKFQSKSITSVEATDFADEGEKHLSDSAKAKKNLCLHVTESVRSGLITCKDDLYKDPVIQTIMSDMNWSKQTVERYTQGCGIPKKKRGRRPKAKNGTNTP